MEPKCCMNELCSAVSSYEWKKGWTLKSGGYATLCHACGSAFENSVFCETFHSEESGWRDCRICEKRIHCGCIASRSLHEYMDFGGIKCSINCIKRLENPPVPSIQTSANIANGTLTTMNGVKDVHSVDVIDNDKLSTERLLKLTKALGVNDVIYDLEELKRKESILKPIESGQHAPILALQSPSNSDNVGLRAKDADKSLAQPSLNLSFATPVRGSTTASPFPVVNAEGSDQSKRTRPSLQKPPKPTPSSGPEATNKGSASQERIARPPVEGKGRNQLLPRYWPKITDQELQQLSGDLKSTIVPLFEKILSASDAGRIGRLVLPKACAEAYFPTINQSEGIPIRIQDIKGKEWTFQFRFWPNNNSRMYVLEGVTPCIQNMQMQAGDTVIFSRRDPGGQLVIGCRKSASNIEVQDSQAPVTADNDVPKANRTSDDSLHKHVSASDKKKAKNIKNKRVRMHNDDAMGLRVTREEAQELFRPYPSSEPSIVLVEEHEFEEFEEPPVFGKKTIFISRPSGEQEQLAQCDVCLSWRRLPVNALLSASWTCSEKVSDSKRYTCWAPEDINPRDLESAIREDSKKRKVSYNTASKEGEPSGLDALATAAVLGDNIVEIGEPSSVGATTTRHPRHRPGCTCIVCSQPPSGKGKHEPTCKCNVCLTVRRRFKTLMMRKKKRMSEREAELNRGKGGECDDNDKDRDHVTKIDEDIAGHALLNMMSAENEMAADVNSNGNNDHNNEDGNVINNDSMDVEEEMNKGKLDLNSAPHKEEDTVVERSGLETCLASRKVASGEGDGAVEKGGVGSGDVQQENKGEEMGNKIVS